MEKKIVDFLIRAKRATYAGKGAETVPSRIGSHDLLFRETICCTMTHTLAATGLPEKKLCGFLMCHTGV